MKSRVIVRTQVKSFLESLAPDPRRKLWRGIKELAEDKGNRLLLDGSLSGFWRLRVDRMRVIFQETSHEGERRIICIFADYRATVYAVFEQLISSGLIGELRDSPDVIEEVFGRHSSSHLPEPED